jgi:hypothetical protein
MFSRSGKSTVSNHLVFSKHQKKPVVKPSTSAQNQTTRHKDGVQPADNYNIFED